MISVLGHEQVVYCNDKETNLKAIIAVHDTTLGPALGGCRFWDYKDEQEALTDVLRLSRGMTYKAAISGLSLGGGKSVIIGDPKKLKSDKFFRSFGRFVQSLNGRYITAEDVNVRVNDIETVRKETKYAVGVESEGGSGDPSPFTAFGVFQGLRAAVDFQNKSKRSLNGLKVAIQGCGSVGYNLAKLLHKEGVALVVSDIKKEAAQRLAAEFNAKIVDTHEIHKEKVDIYSPCALGGILNERTIQEISAPIIAGGANNQLLNEIEDGKRVFEKGILYTPDYVVNAGGLINVAQELSGYSPQLAKAKVEKIYDTITDIFKLSEEKGLQTNQASDKIAQEKIKEIKEARKEVKELNTYNNQDWIKLN